MSEPILTVANMNKKFGSTVALNDVSLTVYPGEIRGLIWRKRIGKVNGYFYCSRNAGM